MKAASAKRQSQRSPRHPLASAALWVALAVTPVGAMAHGEITALHGGMTAWAQEVAVELVVAPTGFQVFLGDHDGPLKAEGIQAHIVVARQGEEPTRVELRQAGADRFVADPSIGAVVGSTVSVVLLFPDGQVARARFRGVQLAAPK